MNCRRPTTCSPTWVPQVSLSVPGSGFPTGARVRQRAVRAATDLTPQEEQVATLVPAGPPIARWPPSFYQPDGGLSPTPPVPEAGCLFPDTGGAQDPRRDRLNGPGAVRLLRSGLVSDVTLAQHLLQPGDLDYSAGTR
jgi:hypothetical protein